MNINTINYDELNKLLKEVQDIVDRGKLNVVFMNRQKFIVYQNGDIYRITKTGKSISIENKPMDKDGYNIISCNGRKFKRHRIIAHAFLKLDIDNEKSIIDHKDKNKLNNNVDNLRVVTKQENSFNTNAKGYSLYKKNKNKYVARIVLNKKLIYLGVFTTKEEAHNVYLNAKLVYHKI